MTDDQRDEKPRQHGVPDDQPTTVNRQQDTPPAGYQVQQDEGQDTVQGSAPPPPR